MPLDGGHIAHFDHHVVAGRYRNFPDLLDIGEHGLHLELVLEFGVLKKPRRNQLIVVLQRLAHLL